MIKHIKSNFNLITLLTIVTIIQISASAQNYIIIEGRVVNSSGSSIVNAHVLNISKKLGTITNDLGIFRIIAATGDSMLVSSMGYKPYRVTVPSQLAYKVFNVKVTLIADTIMLKEAIIRGFPPTYALFKKEFVSLKLHEKPKNKLFDRISDKQYNPKGGIVLPGPISLLYSAFSKEAKNKRKLANLIYQDNLREVVYDKIPKEVLIKAYHLTDESELEQFLDFCQLSENLMINGTPYDVVVEMNIRYKSYPKRKND
jgi:hypothetical protein